MNTSLAKNRYGKKSVRVLKVTRGAERHDVREVSVDVMLDGDLEAAYVKGDNRLVLPTDTMKNTVYVWARDHPLDPLEAFASSLTAHFLDTLSHITRAEVSVYERRWVAMPVTAEGEDELVLHPYAFHRVGPETPMTRVTRTREGVTVASGLRSFPIMKSTKSGFSDFLRDPLTTLRDASDRVLATSLDATWLYAAPAPDFNACRRQIRQALCDRFAAHDSLSVQHTLYAMGEAALAACDAISEINLVMPNKHYLHVDLTPFGKDNPNEIFLPIDEPSGYIEGTVRREG